MLGGVGLGLGYIVPLAMLIPWFPDRRGFITGIAVAGFGLGAFLTGPIAACAIEAVGARATLAWLGAAYLALVVGAAQVFRAAPEGYAPPGWTLAVRGSPDRPIGGIGPWRKPCARPDGGCSGPSWR